MLYGPDVVLVAVGDEEAPDTGFILNQVGHVGDHQVNAVHVVAGEAHAAVHHDDLAAVFVNGHILADLVETAKRDDFHFFCQNIALLFVQSIKISASKAQRKQTGRGTLILTAPRIVGLEPVCTGSDREPLPAMYGKLFACRAARGARQKYFITGIRTNAREKQKNGTDAPPRLCLFNLVYHSFFKKYT